MYAVKLGAAVFINIGDLIMQPDVFVTMLNEKATEQTNVTRTEEKKRNLSSVPVEKKSKISLARIPILSPYLDKLYQTTFLHGSW